MHNRNNSGGVNPSNPSEPSEVSKDQDHQALMYVQSILDLKIAMDN